MEKIRSNFDSVLEYMRKTDGDWVHVTVGGEGKGKSTLNAAIGFYVDDQFSADRMHFNGKDFRNHAMDLPELSAVSHDEAVEDMYKREAMAENVRRMIKFLRKCRYLQLVILLSLPSLSELDRSLWDPAKTDEPRVKSIARVVNPGWAHFYSQARFAEIDTDADNGVEWPDPDYRDDFPNLKQQRPEFWENYMEKKDRDISNDEIEEETELSIKEMAKAVKQKQDRYVAEYKGRRYIDQDLVAADFEIGDRKAKKVKKLAEADLALS